MMIFHGFLWCFQWIFMVIWTNNGDFSWWFFMDGSQKNPRQGWFTKSARFILFLKTNPATGLISKIKKTTISYLEKIHILGKSYNYHETVTLNGAEQRKIPEGNTHVLTSSRSTNFVRWFTIFEWCFSKVINDQMATPMMYSKIPPVLETYRNMSRKYDQKKQKRHRCHHHVFFISPRWLTYPSEKWWSWDDEIPNLLWKVII